MNIYNRVIENLCFPLESWIFVTLLADALADSVCITFEHHLVINGLRKQFLQIKKNKKFTDKNVLVKLTSSHNLY